jgi:hypothetical protein
METLKQAGYTYVENKGNGEHLLKDNSSGNLEVWANSKNHAGFSLKFKNTHLEFCYSIPLRSLSAEQTIKLYKTLSDR